MANAVGVGRVLKPVNGNQVARNATNVLLRATFAAIDYSI